MVFRNPHSLIMRGLWLAITFLLSGCSTFIQADVFSIACIAPLQGYTYVTCNDIYFWVDHQEFKIDKGFVTDLATIPRIFWPFASPAYSPFICPAIIHDWFYRQNIFERQKVDLIFYRMLRSNGISALEASSMYYFVRFLGHPYYDKDSGYGQRAIRAMDKKA